MSVAKIRQLLIVSSIETPLLRLERDPESGRKMINQYLVLHEIGHGTHGRVRLGQDLSIGLGGEDDTDANVNAEGSYYVGPPRPAVLTPRP